MDENGARLLSFVEILGTPPSIFDLSDLLPPHLLFTRFLFSFLRLMRRGMLDRRRPESVLHHTQATLGEGEAVTRDSVGALAFKPGGAQRTKEERAERLREVLGRPALALLPETGVATEADAPVKAGKGGKAGQVLFREKHRHWIAEANQKDAQGRSRDDPAYDPSTLFIPRKVAASIHHLLLLGSFLLCGDDDLTSPRSGRIWRG